MKNRAKEFLELIKPRFSELTTFQSSVSLILILIFYPEPVSKFIFIITRDPGSLLYASLFILLAIAGVGLSFWHVFVRREKDDIEKWIMGAFAVVITGLAGLFATLELLPDKVSILLIFPIMNYLWGLLLMERLVEPEKAMTDDDASIIDVGISLIIIFITFFIAFYLLNYSWSVTLSMCMSISSMILLFYKWVLYAIKVIA